MAPLRRIEGEAMTVQAAGFDAIPPIVLEVEAADRRHRVDFRIRFIATCVVILGVVVLLGSVLALLHDTRLLTKLTRRWRE